jgi:hypothetical protein
LNRGSRAFFVAVALALAACAGTPRKGSLRTPSAVARADVRIANGRPPVAVVAREGDPAAAVGVAITTAGLGNGDPEPAIALAGLLEDRLRALSVDARVTPAWDGVRATLIARTEDDARKAASMLRDAMLAPAREADVAAAKRKLGALARRPLDDRALERWARCVGDPRALPDRALTPADIDAPRLERWRAEAFGIGRTAFAAVGSADVAEAIVDAVLRGPPWRPSIPLPPKSAPAEATFVYERAGEPTLHVTIETSSSDAAVQLAEALGDARSPLAPRLAALEVPFRVREVTGTAHASGGCVGVVLEANGHPPDLATRVADAVSLVGLEAATHLAARPRDGRLLARRSGDAREAAERAAWWTLAERSESSARGELAVALGIPTRRGKERERETVTAEALTAAVARARATWAKPVLEVRSRLEIGQGEAWILLASPCGTDEETDADAGLTALVAVAMASNDVRDDVRIEPWVAADGAGVIVHGPALENESLEAQATRLANVAAKSFAAEPIVGPTLARARADLTRRPSDAALAIVAGAIAPQHPSWLLPMGPAETVARLSDGAAMLRAQALRAGPLRFAMLANGGRSQVETAVRAADRWVPRKSGESRVCRGPFAASPPKPGTYAAPFRPGSSPEAYVAFPLPPADDAALRSAQVLSFALDGEGGSLDRALTGTAATTSARVLGAPRAPALVLRITAPHASLDAAVEQTRAMIDRVRSGAIATADLERSTERLGRAQLAMALDPRARLVATWRGEPVDPAVAPPSIEELKAVAQRVLVEDTMIIVAARPPRSSTP